MMVLSSFIFPFLLLKQIFVNIPASESLNCITRSRMILVVREREKYKECVLSINEHT